MLTFLSLFSFLFLLFFGKILPFNRPKAARNRAVKGETLSAALFKVNPAPNTIAGQVRSENAFWGWFSKLKPDVLYGQYKLAPINKMQFVALSARAKSPYLAAFALCYCKHDFFAPNFEFINILGDPALPKEQLFSPTSYLTGIKNLVSRLNQLEGEYVNTFYRNSGRSPPNRNPLTGYDYVVRDSMKNQDFSYAVDCVVAR